MTKTENFQFNQWDAGDPIRRQDFNRDNAILDAALGAQGDKLEEIAGAVAGLGNCRIVTGSYKGNGTYGSSNPNTLSFPGRPLLVVIVPSLSSACGALVSVYNTPSVISCPSVPASSCFVSWPTNAMRWYNSGGAEHQFYTSGTTYYYVALLQAGA
jgi:hypothetical protein